MVHRRRLLLLPGLAGLALVVLIFWSSAGFVWQRGFADLERTATQELDQFAEHLRGQLARFDFLPELIAKNRFLAEVLNDPRNSARIDLANRYMEEINAVVGAAETYLMDVNGLTLAASNWQSETSFVGLNFSFRPYFKQAMDGRPGHYFALGTTSNERGYYFSHPVSHAAAIIGVVVVKTELTDVEARWSGRERQFLATDEDGVIFITTRPEWLYRTLRPLPRERLDAIVASRRYPGASLEPIAFAIEEELAEGLQIVSVGASRPQPTDRHLALSRAMPAAGWTLHLFAPLDGIARDVTRTLLLAAMLLLLSALAVIVAVERTRRRRERETIEQRAMLRLEQVVAERTADLTHEVEERRRTEQVLRQTQDELIQAAKLAVLGELSASISHELNNPLSAIRSYADNARTLLDRQQEDQVEANLGRIVELTERMAKISSQLKVFARKSRGQLDAVPLAATVAAAVDMMRPQAGRQGVQIDLERMDEGLHVRGDAIQLEQVLINLLSNAIHAVEGCPEQRVAVSCEADLARVTVHVEDSGPGIAVDHLEQIFDPFFTTRKSGLGLGLSISHRIIDGMNGRLVAANRVEGGARFTVTMERDRTD